MSESFKKRSVCTITLLYNGYFGEGRNVNHKWLESKGFFDEYYNGRDKAVAYELDNVTRYGVPKALSDFGLRCPPQSFSYVDL